MIRRLIAAALCHWDIHDLPAGFRRIDADEWRPSVPTWVVCCRWCPGRFVAIAEHPSAAVMTAALIRGRLS